MLNSQLVLIRGEKAKEQDENGIFIQEEWKTKEPIGIVEAVAADVTICKVGDRVWFERYTAIPHPTDPDLKACRQDAIIMVLDA